MNIDFSAFCQHDLAIIRSWFFSFSRLLPYIGLQDSEIGAIGELISLLPFVDKLDTVVFFNLYKALNKICDAEYLGNLHPEFVDACFGVLDEVDDIRFKFIHRYDHLKYVSKSSVLTQS